MPRLLWDPPNLEVMSTSTAVRRLRGTKFGQYVLGGAGGGLAGGVAMGLLLHLTGAETMALIGGVYGATSVLVGWVAHLVHSVILGLVFVATVRAPFLRDFTDTVGGWVAVGVVYGALLEVVSAGVVLPVAVSVLGLEEVPFPPLTDTFAGAVTVAILAAVAHLVYGAVLGGVYGYTRGQPEYRERG